MRNFYYYLLSLFLCGCMVGPDYRPPMNYVPDQWTPLPCPQEVNLEFSQELPLCEWWEVFEDPLLIEYIRMAALHNNDIRVAEANVCRARATRMVAAAPLFPQLSADFNGSRTMFSKNGPLFQIPAPNAPTTPGATTPNAQFTIQVPQFQTLYNATLDMTWELDLFGKTRRNVESADAKVSASIEQMNDRLISVFAEVARNYLEARTAQEKISLTKENINVLEKSADIIGRRVKAGLSNQLDLERIEAEVAQVYATIPNFEALLFQSIYALSVLTGNLPETLVAELLPYRSLPPIPSEVSIGIRSDILRRRPDIRAAERQLASATADIGVAVANFFPTISLFGDEGFQSLMFSNLFQGASNTWSYGGDINLPIFQGGKLVGNLRVAEASATAAAYTYRQTVLQALQETENSMVTFLEDLKTMRRYGDSVGRNEKIVQLSNERYVKGLVSITDLLDSERQLISIQQNRLDAESAALLDLVRLYKALGGGWETYFSECRH
ncbi:efflux transporter outer membrane subunit [Parachlamydia acanthamoebae]|uniref:efflux transporter outer membrane subunit n=1 Tax=Parachlamydia acanthamoebae TaxID=83552 RepID=UPI0009AD5899|nr:efflux transporter outer membrane subunit [Parachlamydia acanthamoebae]